MGAGEAGGGVRGALSDARQRQTDPDSPRLAAEYLVALRPILGDATGSRRALVRSLTSLADDVRRGGSMVAERAGAIGTERIVTFREVRTQLDRLTPPPACEACHLTFGRWISRLIDCCELLHSIGTTGDVAPLSQAQDLIAEAREYARGFNREHASLVAELRELLDDATERARLPIR
jgi:hypothetical protein